MAAIAPEDTAISTAGTHVVEAEPRRLILMISKFKCKVA